MGAAWIVVAAGILAAGGGAYYFLTQDTAPPGSMSVQGDACSGLAASSEVWPTRAPDVELNLTLVEGENVSIMQGPGLWRAKLVTDGPAISPSMPMRDTKAHDWTREYDLMWCHTRPEPKTFLAEGDGTLHLRAWQGTGDGFHARVAWG